MKTTVEISDALYKEAKACAQSRGVPLRQVFEDGLRIVVQNDRKTKPAFKLRDGSFGGKVRHTDQDLETVRKTVYEGRGE